MQTQQQIKMINEQIMNSCNTRCMWGFSARLQILNFTLKMGGGHWQLTLHTCCHKLVDRPNGIT
jgi:hypothetical protein